MLYYPNPEEKVKVRYREGQRNKLTNTGTPDAHNAEIK